MGLTSAAQDRSGPGTSGTARDAVHWHDLECGSYTADLALWSELADLAASPAGSREILEIGAGTGRVALTLARRGHRLRAVEIDPALADALGERSRGLSVRIERADARALDLPGSCFALCVVAMQTIQLLGREGRAAFLAGARAHLDPGGLLACAIVSELEPFDCAAGDPRPEPETAYLDGRLYESWPQRAQTRADSFVIERERRISRTDPGAGHYLDVHTEVIELDRLDAATLTREGLAAGLAPAGVRTVPATEEHVGSEVVVLRA